jgi:predicted alpha/beta hydrolase
VTSRARTRRQWAARRVVARPRASFEELEIRTRDGASLRAVVDDPPGARPLRGTVVLAHALFAHKASFGRREAPGLSSALARQGFRTVAFDFRGHGDSTSPDGPCRYDDLVRSDLPAVVEYARASGDDRPVIVLGHALGGHVALAAQGTGRIDVDAIVTLATMVWARELEPSRLRWAAKAALARVARSVSRRAGAALSLVPSRGGLAPRAASRWHLREVLDFAREGRWTSADGRDDYLAALGRVAVPVAAVLAARDRVFCAPAAGEAFARRCAGQVQAFRAPVGYGGLVTSALAEPVVLEAAARAADQAWP